MLEISAPSCASWPEIEVCSKVSAALVLAREMFWLICSMAATILFAASDWLLTLLAVSMDIEVSDSAVLEIFIALPWIADTISCNC